MMNNNFCSTTLYYSILSLFAVLYETRYDRHNYFWYYRPSIVDPFTFFIVLKTHVTVISMCDQ